MSADGLKEAARARLERAREALLDLSHRIHANPELGYEEEQASTWVAEALELGGFRVERGICELPTAFRGTVGTGPLHVAICAEYDALPDIGHACGHNVIAAAAVGAGLALAEVADDAGLTVSVVGTPAEEGGGGKILMLERGGFEGVHAAMMVHPAPFELVEMPIIAAVSFDLRYTGREAHASAFPELGINAADALVVAQVGIGLLRQHLRQTDRVHGIVTKGGDAQNVVPAHTEAQYMVRASTLAELQEVRDKVMRCFEAGALATGATLEVVHEYPAYAEMRHDPDMARLYRRNAEAIGRTFPDLGDMVKRAAASTDMGNVSLAIPTIHPALGIDSLPAVNHQPAFTAQCVAEPADRAAIEGALAMAWTAIDMAADGQLSRRLIGAEA
ncbi:MAG: M20 family metallopeptidase [Actinomycetota bacterium]|nr:M20 family metallopeptidase [Actinomycetota bacterium]